jgi:protein TonB
VEVKSGASSVIEHASLWGAAVAIAVHVLLAAGFVLLPARHAPASVGGPVEVDLTSSPPEPLPPPPLPDPTPPEPEPEPKLVVHKLVTHIKLPAPMPNQEAKPAPPTDEPPKPVFGVTQDSVVTGESPVAVPVGNTLMTSDRTLAKTPPAPLPAAPPPAAAGAFNPVDDESIDDLAVPSIKVNPDYPEVAKRMGIGGRVHLKIGVDRHGNVRSARVIGRVGYGMDEAALKAIWLHKFHPSKNSKGEPVDSVLTYDIVFQPPSGR